MNLLSDILTYIRRLIKSPSNESITDDLLIDYINRFWINDMSLRVQLFDLKTQYQFQTTPGINQYNMPLYSVQTEPGNQNINFYPVYQGFLMPCRINGITIPLYTQQSLYYNLWPNYIQQLNGAATGDGGTTYNINLPFFPALPGHVDISGIIATGSNDDPIIDNTLNLNVPVANALPAVYFTATDSNGQNVTVCDSGQFLSGNTNGDLYGLLMVQGKYPLGNTATTPIYDTVTGTVNYTKGYANVIFPSAIPAGNPINAQCYFYQQGIPRAILFYNNTITLRPPPDKQYLVELEAYLTPAAFLTTSDAIQFGYMAEYIARGAARKILADTGDIEQFQFYEQLFREQELLVWKRSQRQITATRTDTIYSNTGFQSNYNQSSIGT